jgi:hypothetical protein
MKKYRKISAIVLIIALFLTAGISFASEITVGTKQIDVPRREGFAEIRETFPDAFAFFRDMTPPGNNLRAVLVTEADAGALSESRRPEYGRYFLVQTNESLEDTNVNAGDFAQIKEASRSALEKIFAEQKPRIDEISKNLSKSLSKNLDAAVEMKIGETIPVVNNSESGRHFTFSSLSKQSVSFGGEESEYLLACTGSIVLLRERLIYLYAYSAYDTIDDLNWTQSEIEKWTAAAIEENAI